MESKTPDPNGTELGSFDWIEDVHSRIHQPSRPAQSAVPVPVPIHVPKNLQTLFRSPQERHLSPAPISQPTSDFNEFPFLPTIRPPLGYLTIFDDGEPEVGEIVRIRHEQTTIGRGSADVNIPHDARMSAPHAEIVRFQVAENWNWVLRDLQSTNGTFVRSSRATLTAETVLLFGIHRYRIEINDSSLNSPCLSLINATTKQRYPIHSKATIGVKNYRSDIELDDPCLAPFHATIYFDLVKKKWRLVSENTLNGVWIKSSEISLTANNYFRCGEQLFRFHVKLFS